MSTTGNRRVGRPQPRVALRMLRKARRDREGYIEDHLDTYRVIGSKGLTSMRRASASGRDAVLIAGIHPAGSARQMAAIVTAPDRTRRLAELRVPVTVIHGDADPLVNCPGAAPRRRRSRRPAGRPAGDGTRPAARAVAPDHPRDRENAALAPG